jgi:class 3 adenylate cyclase/tetratricopeptide (TPR) repeat protein
MERKLATVLFIDLVDSTRLVTGADPEVVRRRVTQFFDRVSDCIETYGGIVEKFAGDAVLAAFGIPQAHEDDAERAARAALAMRESVKELGLEARIGIESGEIVFDHADSTFATGEAVNLAARLQQTAKPGEILFGPTAYRLSRGRIVVEDAGPLELKGLEAALRAWRVVSVVEGSNGQIGLAAPLVGRETELELLQNTFSRTLRDGRAHLFTIYGEPGVGKSRLAREFVDSADSASVLSGRCLPYGEGITYWPLAEMVKAAAGISDDEPLEEAFEKLRACCEDDAVADLIGLATGLLEALEGDHSPQEIAWAAREIMHSLAEVQPLILLFEDIHWAEEPLLDLIEQLADWVRSPLLIVCLARPDLLDVRPGWGGGRVRSTAIELEPLSEQESEELVEALVSELDAQPKLTKQLLERTEGNPLFVEETIRMLAEGGDTAGIPDTLQALIAARIDHLPASGKTLLQRAAVVGRVFWDGSLAHLAPDVDGVDQQLEDLMLREFVLREPRSSIAGEKAYRFKHVLIREVAYGGLSKAARAQHHGRFAQWLKERAPDELLEIRAYHLDQAALLLAELDGAPPQELATETAEALTAAGKRALARESFKSARKLLLRALELEPNLRRRYHAARAAWRLGDLHAVSVEMEKVREEAREQGDRLCEALALTALGEATLRRTGDPSAAQALVDEALALLEGETDADAHFDALMARSTIDAWRGDIAATLRHVEQAFSIAIAAGRKDLQTMAAQVLAQTHIVRLEYAEAERLLRRAEQLAEESGSIRVRGQTKLTLGWLYHARGELDEAEATYEEARALFTEIGSTNLLAASLGRSGEVAYEKGDLRRAEKLFRETVRLLAPLGQSANITDFQGWLAVVLADQGKLDEAERFVQEVEETADATNPQQRHTLVFALGALRAAQGRDEEAEKLYREALAISRDLGYPLLEVDALKRLAQFLGERGRDAEAVALAERLLKLAPLRSTAEIA